MPVLPPLLQPNDEATRITPEVLEAFKGALSGDRAAWTKFHVLTAWRPWWISPVDVWGVPEPDGEPEGPWEASWWRAAAFRRALEAR